MYIQKERDISSGVWAYSSWFFRAMNKDGSCRFQVAANSGTGATGGGVTP
jgi:hypothetical protein